MEEPSPSQMDKRMSRHKQGFTLIEMLLVLSIISVCSLSAMAFPRRMGGLEIQAQLIKDVLKQHQAYALLHKKKVNVSISDHAIKGDFQTYNLSSHVHCTASSFTYNERGNVNKGGTIVCTQGNHQKEIVVNLGSGNVYVK